MQKSHGIALLGCAFLVAGTFTPRWGWALLIAGAILLLASGVYLIQKGR